MAAKVFTTSPGLSARIGEHGTATNDSPAVVPDAVAAELAGQEGLRVEREAPAEEPKKKGRKAQEAEG